MGQGSQFHSNEKLTDNLPDLMFPPLIEKKIKTIRLGKANNSLNIILSSFFINQKSKYQKLNILELLKNTLHQ